MTTLEKVRVDIAQLQDEWFKETDGWWCYEKALRIIDKYAEQEPKTGHWILTIEDWNKWTCSKCGYVKRTDIHVNIGWKFCPNCGAKMVKQQENEDKNGKNDF